MLVPRRATFPNISAWAKLSLKCSGQEKVLMLSFHSSLAQIVNETISQDYVPSGCDSKGLDFSCQHLAAKISKHQEMSMGWVLLDLRPVKVFPMCWFFINEIMEAIGHS